LLIGEDVVIDIVKSIEELKKKHMTDMNDINDHINNFKFHVPNITDIDKNEITSLNIFQNFKEEIKNLLNNYSILQYKDLESEEIGKVISNVNKYLNELKLTTIDSFSHYISNKFIERNKILDFQSNYDNILNHNKSWNSEFTELMIKFNNEKEELMNKINNYQNKYKEKENLKLVNDNNKKGENNENLDNNNNNKDVNDDDNDENSNIKNIDSKNNISEHNNNLKNDTQTNLNELTEIRNFYNTIINNFNEFFNHFNININNLREKLIINNLIF